jgi:hypothetical protein
VRKQHDDGSGDHVVLCCRECGSDRVELLAAQVATDETPTRHVDGRAERPGYRRRARLPDPDKSRDRSTPSGRDHLPV